jgi:NAD(P)-dependent dehydrogenase (short-subunit alcohol dehydrogenase family)
VDLRGTMLTAHCAIRRMLAAGGGRLVTIYGNLGDRQQGYVSAFAVAQAGVARLTSRWPASWPGRRFADRRASRVRAHRDDRAAGLG